VTALPSTSKESAYTPTPLSATSFWILGDTQKSFTLMPFDKRIHLMID
jgi:hypothetical protein